MENRHFPSTRSSATPDVLFGISDYELRRLLDQREIRRVLQGVYVDNALPDSRARARVAALMVSLHADSATAARHWLLGRRRLAYREQGHPAARVFVLRGRAQDRATAITAWSGTSQAHDIVESWASR